MPSKKFNQTQKKTNFVWETLLLQNFWPISQPVKFSSKNLSQYLLGSRSSTNIFKYDQLRHLLLKLSPFIRALFSSYQKIQKKIGRYTYYVPPTPPRDPSKFAEWQKRMKASKITKFKKKRHYYQTVEKPKPIKVLFASTNPIYSEVVESAADLCNMPFHTHRWLCGALTANATVCKTSQLKEINLTSDQPETVHKTHLNFSDMALQDVSKVRFHFLKKYQTNKELPEKRYNWHQLQKKSKRPTIVIIPDIHNNDMILRETLPLNIPVIGLVNSSCQTPITYPIFGNADSIEIVHFFCHFLAVLIAKEVVQQDYKNQSHRTFARTRWLLEKDSIKMPRKVFKDRPTKLSNRRPRSLEKRSLTGQSGLSLAQKKRRRLRKGKIKQRSWLLNHSAHLALQDKRWKIQRLQSKPWKHLKNSKIARQDKFWRKKSAFLLKKRRRMLARSTKFFYKYFELKKRKVFGARRYNRRKARRNRIRMNKIIGHRFIVQKNAQWLVFEDKYHPSIHNWRGREQTTLSMAFKLFFIFQHPKLKKKRISKFFRKYSALTYLAYSLLPQASKTRSRDARKAIFFEFHVNQKQNRTTENGWSKPSSPFSLTSWNQELLTTNESIWRNNYATYWKTQNKKKRMSAFYRYRLRRKQKKNPRKFRGKVRLVRINKPYNWRSTKALITKHRIKALTRLWTKTQQRIYRDYQNEFWTEVSWYFDKKKRRKFWIYWRMQQRLPKLGQRIRFKKSSRRRPKKQTSGLYKPNFRWQQNASFNRRPKRPSAVANHSQFKPSAPRWTGKHNLIQRPSAKTTQWPKKNPRPQSKKKIK